MSRLLYIIRDKKAIDLSLFLKGFQEKTSLYIIAKQRMILFPCAAKSARAALSAQVIHEICDHHRHDDKLPDPGIFRKCLGLISHIADNGVDLASVAGIHRGQLADHPFCRQAAPGEYIGGITIRHLRSHANDAGADVYMPFDCTLEPGGIAKIPLGFGLEVPDGYAAYVFPRSSLAAKGVVCELPPVDSGYRGEIHAIVSNVGNEAQTLAKDSRIGQLIIMPVVIADFVNDLGGQRGAGAFGSTGK